jgi:UDPglucose 6-dehydrogenase
VRYRVGIVGSGVVGTAVAALFGARHDVVIYDEPKRVGSRADINTCDYAFICVPTPMLPDGRCDTSIVEEVVSWISRRLTVICHSTVEVGTTSRLSAVHPRLVFSPEYYGEGISHPLQDLSRHAFVILGGDNRQALEAASQLYQTVYNSQVRIFKTDATTAEVVKYMENAYLATKVTFCNEMYDFCQANGVDYDVAREMWLLDERIGRSHTFVYPGARGFNGKCLPKDTAALLHRARQLRLDLPAFQAAVESNCRRYLLGRNGSNSAQGNCGCGLHTSESRPEAEALTPPRALAATGAPSHAT